MVTFKAWLRFAAVVLCMAILIIAVVILSPFSSLYLIRYPIRRVWSRCLIASTGAKLCLHGQDISKIDLSNIHSGVYIVQITDEENKIYQKRLIKN